MSKKSWNYLIKNDLNFHDKWKLNTNPVHGGTFISKEVKVPTKIKVPKKIKASDKISNVSESFESTSNEQFIDKIESEFLVGKSVRNINTGTIYEIYSISKTGFPCCYNAINSEGSHSWLSVSKILQGINISWEIVESQTVS